jgi:type IV pilus assembly protein PilQ
VEAEALAVDKVSVTRFLSYAKAKDVIVTVKKFLSQRGDVVADDRTNAVIINDIPKSIPTIDRLLTQLDRKTQEVEIEARVVAATRQFARDIGTQLGFGWGNGHSAIGGNQTAGTSPTTVSGGSPGYIVVPGTGTGNTIPLFSNLGSTSPTSGLSFVSASNTVRIDAVLSMAESRGLLKVLSRPRVVTQNNIQALVKQGVRVPIVTQAQLGGPPTVTYVDAFLRLTVTPQITSENTIFLNVDVENTTPNFGQEVQGNPELITQQATTQVLVTDGGTVVIGGVIQTQNSINITQVPLLGNLPILGNLFKHTQVNTSNQELIFFITPRIIQT